LNVYCWRVASSANFSKGVAVEKYENHCLIFVISVGDVKERHLLTSHSHWIVINFGVTTQR